MVRLRLRQHGPPHFWPFVTIRRAHYRFHCFSSHPILFRVSYLGSQQEVVPASMPHHLSRELVVQVPCQYHSQHSPPLGLHFGRNCRIFWWCLCKSRLSLIVVHDSYLQAYVHGRFVTGRGLKITALVGLQFREDAHVANNVKFADLAGWKYLD